MIRSALSRLSLVRKYENLNAVRHDWIHRHYPPEFSQSQQIVIDVDVCKHQQCGFDVIRNSNVTFIFPHDIGKQIKYFIEIKIFSFQNFPKKQEMASKKPRFVEFSRENPNTTSLQTYVCFFLFS